VAGKGKEEGGCRNGRWEREKRGRQESDGKRRREERSEKDGRTGPSLTES